MSRSNYSDDSDGWALIRWRGAVESAIRGKRGQKFLIELAEAMDAMPVKELIAKELRIGNSFCALGVVGEKRGIDLRKIDPEDSRSVAEQFGIADAMAREIVYMNDEAPWYDETPAQRWARMRTWVYNSIKKETA
jgi:hypothetical protein